MGTDYQGLAPQRLAQQTARDFARTHVAPLAAEIDRAHRHPGELVAQLGDLGFMPHEETGKFIADGNTRPGGKLPLNTNGGGLSYMHSGMYGMYALQESVRQMRGIAPAQVKDAKISVCHGVGGMFAASGTIVFSNEAG